MKRKLILSLIIVMFALITGKSSYAAVEIVPSKSGDGKDAFVNISVSESYLQCRQMKETGGSLKGVGSNVEPHLATNRDWGAVSYLANSIYGTNASGTTEVQINEVKYRSTTPNITGVMNWGSNPNQVWYNSTYTAGLMSQYTPNDNETQLDKNVKELYINRNTAYVEFLDFTDNSNLKGMGITELMTNNRCIGTDVSKPVSVRKGWFSGITIGSGNAGSYNGMDGAASNACTFRPVIWN